jgi:hypothetical protein
MATIVQATAITKRIWSHIIALVAVALLGASATDAFRYFGEP